MPRRCAASRMTRSKNHRQAGSDRPASRSPMANTAAPTGRPISWSAWTASNPCTASARSSSRAALPRPILLRLKGKLGGFSGHPMIDHFRFLASTYQARRRRRRSRRPRRCISAAAARRCRRRSIRRWTILSPTSAPLTARRCGRSRDAGCRYLQLDEVNIAYLCDPEQRGSARARRRSRRLLLIYAGMINAAIADKPDEMTITMHLCRGNFRSTFVA